MNYLPLTLNLAKSNIKSLLHAAHSSFHICDTNLYLCFSVTLVLCKTYLGKLKAYHWNFVYAESLLNEKISKMLITTCNE